MGRILANGALVVLLGCAQAQAQEPNGSDKSKLPAWLILGNAEVVGFQSTPTEVQVMYRLKLPNVDLVLCKWKLQPKPTATGCVALPNQPASEIIFSLNLPDSTGENSN